MTTKDPADETTSLASREAPAHEPVRRTQPAPKGVREVCPYCGTAALVSDPLKHQLWCIHTNP